MLLLLKRLLLVYILVLPLVDARPIAVHKFDPNDKSVSISTGLNASHILHSHDRFLSNLLRVYGKTLDQYSSTADVGNAINALSLDDRSRLALKRHYKSQLLGLSEWVKASEEVFYPSTTYPSSLIQFSYGTSEIPAKYKAMWSKAKNGEIAGTSKNLGLGAKLKDANNQKDYVVLDSKFNVTRVGKGDVTYFLVLVSQNPECENCKAQITVEEIDEAIDILLLEALKRDMISFGATLTDKSGKYDTNNWTAKFTLQTVVKQEKRTSTEHRHRLHN